MAGRDFFTPQTYRQLIERSKFQTAVAGDAGNGRLAIQITVDERLHHVALEFLLEVQDVERKTQFFRDATRIIDIIQRAATGRQRLTIFVHTDAAPLVPQLHRKTDELVALLLQDGGRRGRIDTT